MRPLESEVVNYGSNNCLVHDVTPDVDAFPHQFQPMMLISDMKASRKCVQDVACQGVELRNSLELWNVTPWKRSKSASREMQIAEAPPLFQPVRDGMNGNRLRHSRRYRNAFNERLTNPDNYQFIKPANNDALGSLMWRDPLWCRGFWFDVQLEKE